MAVMVDPEKSCLLKTVTRAVIFSTVIISTKAMRRNRGRS